MKNKPTDLREISFDYAASLTQKTKRFYFKDFLDEKFIRFLYFLLQFRLTARQVISHERIWFGLKFTSESFATHRCLINQLGAACLVY